MVIIHKSGVKAGCLLDENEKLFISWQNKKTHVEVNYVYFVSDEKILHKIGCQELGIESLKEGDSDDGEGISEKVKIYLMKNMELIFSET